MKKTLTVNLNSIVFNIDEDAFEVLNKYLADISGYFSAEEERNEIMTDIEARVAELFSERLDRNKNVITIDDVNEIITILGNPNQFSGEDEKEEQRETPPPPSEKKKKRKRFYRDPENAFLGGVASGLAAYLGIDITVVRILLIVLIFLTSGFIIPTYILVWLIAPEARTLSQRLEMQGEDVTVETIKSEFDNAKNYVESDNFKNSVNSIGRTLGNIVMWIVKAFLIFIGTILAFVGLVVIIALIIALFAFIFATPEISDFFFGWNIFSSSEGILLPLIALFFVIGCPIFSLIYGIVRTLSSKKDRPYTVYWVTLALWLAGIFMLVSIGAHAGIKMNESGITINGEQIDWDDSKITNEVRTLEEFNVIDVSGALSLNIIQADTQSVVLSAKENMLPEIITDVKNGVLRVNTVNIRNTKLPVKLDITVKNLNEITAGGASNIRTESTLKTENLNIHLQGASKANLDVEVANMFEIRMEGASKLNLEGTCETVKIEAYGASKINSENLIAKYVDIEMAGAGTAKIYASESLNAGAFGASKISCIGSPEIVNKNTHIGSSITVK